MPKINVEVWASVSLSDVIENSSINDVLAHYDDSELLDYVVDTVYMDDVLNKYDEDDIARYLANKGC